MTSWTYKRIPRPRLVTKLDANGLPYLKVHADDWDDWKAFCIVHGWSPLNSGRLAWCGNENEYLGETVWFGINSYGETRLV